MALRIKKRKKNRRYRGSKGCGGGFRQKRRGKGNQGGVGMSGTGKRSSQKMGYGQRIAKEAGFESYFGKRGFTSAPTARKKNDVLNLDEITKLFAGQKEIKLEGYKVLGEGEGFKATITAMSASKSAIEKMEKAGGKIFTLLDKNKEDSKRGKILGKNVLPVVKEKKVAKVVDKKSSDKVKK